MSGSGRGRVHASCSTARSRLRPLLVEQSAETEARRYYSEEIHRAFEDAGFYRSLIPHRYGGLELDMTNWLRLIAELAHGDIQAAWGFTLAAGHALQVASFWEERAQDEMFGNGDFRAASVAAPIGHRREGRRRLARHRRLAVLLRRAVLDVLHGPDPHQR